MNESNQSRSSRHRQQHNNAKGNIIGYILVAFVFLVIFFIGKSLFGGHDMSKDDLKTSFYNVETEFAQVIIDSQSKEMTNKKAKSEANKAIDKINDEISDLQSNNSNKKMANHILKYANYEVQSLKGYVKLIDGKKNPYPKAAYRGGAESQIIADKYFNGKHSSTYQKYISMFDDDSSSAETSSSDAPSNELSNSSIKRAIKDNAGGVDLISVNGSYVDSDSTVQIEIKGKEAFTNKQTYKGMLMDISSIWKVFKDDLDYSQFSSINISVTYPLTDDGGNSSDEYVIKSEITGNKLSEFNSDRFIYKNVPSFATDWWQSDALPNL